MTLSVLWVLLGACVIACAYCWLLERERIASWYSPDWIWLTVVGGNALIGGVIAVFCAISLIPWLAFQLLFATNVAMGVPVIAWQIGQARTRRQQREGDPIRAKTTERRASAD